jgi:hypothetical protein
MFNVKEEAQMKALEQYVEQKNSWGKLFGSKPLSLSNAKDRQAIANSIDSDLSPENLSCDGELSRSAVNARYTQLTRAAAQLQKLDPSVKFYEYA